MLIVVSSLFSINESITQIQYVHLEFGVFFCICMKKGSDPLDLSGHLYFLLHAQSRFTAALILYYTLKLQYTMNNLSEFAP